MILSTNPELRLHIPSNAVDDVALLQGILDNSEHDFLLDKLGKPLYDRLCEYYRGIDPSLFYDSVVKGSYDSDPWAMLLVNAQRMITNDALARFAYQQVISVNNSGINVVSGNDYGNADDRLLERGVSGYKKEAFVSLNNLLTLLETWAKELPISATPAGGDTSPTPDEDDADSDTSPTSAKKEIVTLWQSSRYYYLHSSLLISSCAVLQPFFNVYENRDKFIQMLPDLHYIQEELIAPSVGEDFIEALAEICMKGTKDKIINRIIRSLRAAIAAELESRTKVISTEKDRRQMRHDEFVHLLNNACLFIQKNQSAIIGTTVPVNVPVPEDSSSDLSATVPDASISVLSEAFKSSPLYVPEIETDQQAYQPSFHNNARGSVLFALPGIN